jgi:DNA replication protein DnaC
MALSNEAFGQIMREYEIRLREREDLIDERRREVYSAIPELADIDREIASRGRDKLAGMLAGDADASDSSDRYHEYIEAQISKKAKLMSDHGYPSDYLDPPYTCEDCHDTGYIGHERCHCLRQRILDMSYRQQPLMAQLEGADFRDFSLDYYPADSYDKSTGASARDSAARALQDTRTYAEDPEGHSGNFVIYGTTGSGKTFLSCCVGSALRNSGHTVVYQTAGRLFELMSDHTFRRDTSGRENGYSEVYNCDLLIIDDLGTELVNDFTRGALFDLLNYRMIAGKATIVSTNLSLQEILDTYTGRVFSRLMEHYVWLHLFGSDIRIRKSAAAAMQSPDHR